MLLLAWRLVASMLRYFDTRFDHRIDARYPLLRCFDASIRLASIRRFRTSFDTCLNILARILGSIIEAKSVLGRFDPRYLAPMLVSICGHFDNRLDHLLASVPRRLGTWCLVSALLAWILAWILAWMLDYPTAWILAWMLACLLACLLGYSIGYSIGYRLDTRLDTRSDTGSGFSLGFSLGYSLGYALGYVLL
jgi:hypothetical protein